MNAYRSQNIQFLDARERSTEHMLRQGLATGNHDVRTHRLAIEGDCDGDGVGAYLRADGERDAGRSNALMTKVREIEETP